MAVKNKPKRASSTCGSARLPMVSKVSVELGVRCPLVAATCATVSGNSERVMVIKPDNFKPIIVMKRPIPTVMVIFIEAGIPSTIILAHGG